MESGGGGGGQSTSAGKKRWTKLKSALQFSAKIKNAEQEALFASCPADLEYLLVTFIPHANNFRAVCNLLRTALEDSAADPALRHLSAVIASPGLTRVKLDHHGHPRMEKGFIKLEFNEDPDTEGDGSNPKIVMISLAFSNDPAFSYLCLPDEDRDDHKVECNQELYAGFDRIFALNPQVEILRQTSLCENPHEVRSWVRGFQWAFPQMEDDSLIGVDPECDKLFLHRFLATCLMHDLPRVISRKPVSGLIQISADGDWQLTEPARE